jgi:hypothetical protein
MALMRLLVEPGAKDEESLSLRSRPMTPSLVPLSRETPKSETPELATDAKRPLKDEDASAA